MAEYLVEGFSFEASFASTDFIDERGVGVYVQLAPELADFSLVQSRQCRYHVDHNRGRPVGLISNARHERDLYRMDVEIPSSNSRSIREFLDQRASVFADGSTGLRGDTSLGYVSTGDWELADPPPGASIYDLYVRFPWRLVEVSDVTVPADTQVGEGRSREGETPRPSGLVVTRGGHWCYGGERQLERVLAKSKEHRDLLTAAERLRADVANRARS